MTGSRYAHPPIDEAICQFTLAERLPWDGDTPRHLFEKLRVRYPAMPAQQQILQANLTPSTGDDGPSLNVNPTERIVFADSENLSRLSIGPQIIAVHRVRPYIGFEQDMLPRSQQGIEAAIVPLQASPLFSSISIRYINRIAVDSSSFDLNEYFNYWGAGDTLPQGIDGTVTGFFYRTTIQQQSTPLSLALSFGSVVAPKDTSAFVLDLDLTYPFEEPADSAKALTQLIDVKATENALFESLITDKTRRLFQ